MCSALAAWLLFVLLFISKGIGANLLKAGIKRRRTKAEVSQAKLEVELKEEAEAAKNGRIADLEARLAALKQEVAKNSNAAAILHQMHEAGVIEQDVAGNVNLRQQPSHAGTPEPSPFASKK